MTGRLDAIAWKDKPRAPMIEADAARISRASGIAGDFRGASPGRQVTIVFAEDWAAACAALGETVPWTLRRANLLVSGLANPRRIGARIRVGGVLLEVGEETEPCSVMDKQRQGLRAALEPDWRAGVACIVVEDGAIAVGDPVEIV